MKGFSPIMFEDFVKPFQINLEEVSFLSFFYFIRTYYYKCIKQRISVERHMFSFSNCGDHVANQYNGTIVFRKFKAILSLKIKTSQ